MDTYNVLFVHGTFVNNSSFRAENDEAAKQIAVQDAQRFGSKYWVLQKYTGTPGVWDDVASQPEMEPMVFIAGTSRPAKIELRKHVLIYKYVTLADRKPVWINVP